MAIEPGLRERKKERTRRLLAETAQRLFAERGFDAVTVADVAREADVSAATVFNYFPTKEDLFYGQMEAFEAALVEAVRARPRDVSVLAAVRDEMLVRSARLESEDVAETIVRAARIVTASPSLLAREREIVENATEELAQLIREETGAAPDDVEAAVVADALMGVQRSLKRYVWASVLAGRRGPSLAEDVRSQAARGFARLEAGLADYGVRR